jgi:molybdopterin/thiamine biosynthesis adenylyltransferase
MAAKRTKISIAATPKKATQEWDEVYQRISWWDSDRMANAKVMVVGSGALGNEVLKNLALLNIGHLLIVDFDSIEYNNLSRSVLFREKDCGRKKADVAAERIKELNPNVKVLALHGDIAMDIGLGVFRRMDVIVGCLDNRVARLFINRHSFKVGKTWVDGAIENLSGQMDVYSPEVACYECQLTDREFENIWDRWSCPDVAARNATFGKIPTTPISASLIAALQTQEALKIVYGDTDKSMAGERFKFFGRNNTFLQSGSAPLKDDCLSHSTIEKVIEAKDLSCDTSLKDCLQWLEKHFEDPEAKILLDDELVLELTTKDTEVANDVLIPRWQLSDQLVRSFQKTPGEQVLITSSSSVLDTNFPHQEKPLSQLGVPFLQILTVEAAGDIHFVELTGDADKLQFQ